MTQFTDALYTQLPNAVLFMYSVLDKLSQIMQKHFKGVNALHIEGEMEQMIKDLKQEA